MSGSREETLQIWWAATSALTDLLPAARVFTHAVRDDDQAQPYALIEVRGTGTLFRTSSGRYEGAEVTVRVYADDEDAYETARAIARALETHWGDRGTYNPGSGPRVWQMDYVDSGPAEDEDADGAPHFAVQLSGVFAE